MFSEVFSQILSWSMMGSSFVAPGMSFSQVRELIPERPVILNRTQGRVRGVEFPTFRIILTLDEHGRVTDIK